MHVQTLVDATPHVWSWDRGLLGCVVIVTLCVVTNFSLHVVTVKRGGRGGSIARASASRSNGFHDHRFESRPEHKKHL